MTPITVHQAEEYYQYLQSNILLDWIVHHTPFRYMGRDGCLKVTTKFSTVCGASTIKNQIILFDGHDIHFDECELLYIEDKNI